MYSVLKNYIRHHSLIIGMYDVITIGSAARDVFVKSKALKVLKSSKFTTGRAIAMSLGSKLAIDELNFFVGGGAVNTAATFARQGLRTAAFTTIGHDPGGKAVEEFFKKEEISPKLLFKFGKDQTMYSFILSLGKPGRSILRYVGVAWELHRFFSPKELIKTKWWYLNHLGGKSADLIPKLFSLAKKNKIQIAWNPGSTQLKLKKLIKPFLAHTDVFMVNQEEASLLTGIPYKSKDKIFDVLNGWVKGIVIMTRGPRGVMVSDGEYIWQAGVLPLKNVVDRTGAGDSFGSGFVASLIQKPNNIERAIRLASVNATSLLTQWGATHGLLRKSDPLNKWGKLEIKKRKM